MCIICHAKSLDHAVELIEEAVETIGWTAVAVPPANGRPAWCYTIGLEESYGHAELVVVTCDPNAGLEVLRSVAYLVEDGDAFLPGDHVPTTNGAAEIVEVHPAQRSTPLLAMRDRYRAAIDGALPARPPLQIVAAGLDCPAHPIERWRLDRPLPQLAGTMRPPRHVRRARSHGGRRAS